MRQNAVPRSSHLVLPVVLLVGNLAGITRADAHVLPRQLAKPTPALAASAPAPAAPAPPPPYEPQLLKLAELTGTIAFMRGLCHDADAPQWRGRVEALIQSTAKSPAQRSALIGAYNRGYGSYALTYHRCTANARVVIDRAMARSRAIATTVMQDYGVAASD